MPSGNSGIGFINQFKLGTLSAGASENGMPASNLSTDRCTPSTGWQTPAGVVSHQLGAILYCRLTASTTWRAFNLVNTNLTFSAQVTASLYSNNTLVAAVSLLHGPQPGYRQVPGDFGADILADQLQITIDDIGNPDGYIRVGGAFAGPLWLPTRGVSWDTTYGSVTRLRSVVTDGGQEYRSQKSRQRKWTLALDSIRDSEAWDDLGELDRIASLGGNVLFIPNIRSVDISREAIFGVLDVVSDVSFTDRAVDSRAWRATITERL